MAQFVLKIEKLSHIIGARESRDLRSPSPIMAPDFILFYFILFFFCLSFYIVAQKDSLGLAHTTPEEFENLLVNLWYTVVS